MAQNNYNGKWRDWIWKVRHGKWIVAEVREGVFFTKVTHLDNGEIHGESPNHLLVQGAIAYANPNAAIKVLKRVYNPPDASKART